MRMDDVACTVVLVLVLQQQIFLPRECGEEWEDALSLTIHFFLGYLYDK
jgi:hypothetical protein